MKRHILTALVLLGLAAAARADGFLVPVGREHPVRGAWAVRDHRVSIAVDGQSARTEVRQTFVNLTRGTLEVDYLFPIPEGAMIDAFTLVVDGVEMPGRILSALEAIRIYEEIVRSKRDPALLTYAGRGLVRTKVFPIPGGGTREVVVRYTELLTRDAGLVKVHYPLDTERFSATPIEVVDVAVTIRSGPPLKAVYSPSHPIRVERTSAHQAVARWTAEHVVPDRDLLLYYSTGEGPVSANLLTYRPPGEKAGYFLLLLNPRAHLKQSEVIGKNLVVVLDHSGSMKGEKIHQAKEALRFVVNSLGPRDRLNLVLFSSTANALFPEPRDFGPEVRDRALAAVDGIEAGGGTDIHSALGLALSGLSPDPERQNTILFLTDGLPTVGVRDTKEIVAAVAGANREVASRLFVFGVGYDVNAQFLDRLVEENGGVSENVLPKASVEIAVTSLYEKIRYAALTDLAMKFDGVEVTDLYPRRLPDLFAGSQLVVTGRYEKGGPASLVLGGSVGRTRKAFRFPLRFESESDPDERPFVARLWATNKIGFLLDQMRVMGRQEKELVDEIVRLSTKYGVVTEYTAFLADETNDFRAFAENSKMAGDRLQGRLGQVVGGAGANQALNSKELRHRQQADDKNKWNDDEGREVEILTVRNVGRKTFYRRGGVWVDREAPEAGDVEEVRYLSARFFELVRGQTAAENRWFSFNEPAVVQLGARTVRLLPAE